MHTQSNAKKVNDFINNFTTSSYKSLDKKLVEAIVEEVGGADRFHRFNEQYADAGYYESDRITDFFNENQSALLDFASEMAVLERYNSVLLHVSEKLDRGEHDLDKVARALYGSASLNESNAAIRRSVAGFVVSKIAIEIYVCYTAYIEVITPDLPPPPKRPTLAYQR